MNGYPIERPRRLRGTARVRELVAGTRLHPARFIQPHFVLPGEGRDEEIPSMPGIRRQSPDRLAGVVESDLKLGIGSILLFGLPEKKDPRGDAAADENGPVPAAIRTLKERFGADLCIVTDVCLCAYTTHGHCGVIDARSGRILNDESLGQIAAMALAHARAGADFVAPSDMMDGRVRAIRTRLDERGHAHVGILSYAVKFASAYYGPFRDAAESAPAFGDRQSYQMDVRNLRDALREARLDVGEGADIVMVKPALAYLDVIAAVRAAVDVPVACYNVSGEFSMVKAAARNGWIDEARVVRENLLAMARAGADVILTYHAREALAGGWL